MTTGTTTSRERLRASFQALLQKYPEASLEEALGLMHALNRSRESEEHEATFFSFLVSEAEYASEQELQELAMKFLIRREMEISPKYIMADNARRARMHVCLGLLARTNWRGRLATRDWKTVQEFVAQRLDDEGSIGHSEPPIFDHAICDQALINTCNWTALITSRVYRVIPKLYDLVLCRVSSHLPPEQYQSGRYLPESGLFHGEYHLSSWQTPRTPPSGFTDSEELARIGRDVLRTVILCGDAKLERGLQHLDAERATTLFALVATLLDGIDMRPKIESVLPIPRM